MRRTISNLSREIGISRKTIYKHLARLKILKTEKGEEYTLSDWNRLKDSILSVDQSNHVVINTSIESKETEKKLDVDKSTIRQRLLNAKEEYDFNRKMIQILQKEIDAHIRIKQSTVDQNHMKTSSVIPQIDRHEKYIKLNIQVSKLISDLEADLDLESGNENESGLF